VEKPRVTVNVDVRVVTWDHFQADVLESCRPWSNSNMIFHAHLLVHTREMTSNGWRNLGNKNFLVI